MLWLANESHSMILLANEPLKAQQKFKSSAGE